jgi:polyhydroxybutyrate depolymerase
VNSTERHARAVAAVRLDASGSSGTGATPNADPSVTSASKLGSSDSRPVPDRSRAVAMRALQSWRFARRLGVGLAILSAAVALATPALVAPAALAEPAPAKRSSGCGSPTVAGATTEMLDVAGTPRQFRLAVPSEPTGKRPLPLILNFHGAGANSGGADGQAVYSQLEEKGPARGFVVVTPNAGDPPVWGKLELNFSEASDANLAFTRALINNAKASLCIDAHRIYATGFSDGAGMSTYLGCKLSRQLAAIAPVSGVNLAEPCPHGKPTSVIAFHGTADPNVAYGGGPGALKGRPDRDLPSVEAAVQAWAQRAKCRATPTHQAIGTEVQRIAYRGCDRANAVVLYAVTGGGHTWPGSSIDAPMFGHTTQDINAADLILDFFSHHPAPAKNAKS